MSNQTFKEQDGDISKLTKNDNQTNNNFLAKRNLIKSESYKVQLGVNHSIYSFAPSVAIREHNSVQFKLGVL